MRASTSSNIEVRRLHVELQGIVQGVGFRPFVSRLAQDLQLGGWVRNLSRGIAIEVEGEASGLDQFVYTLRENPPAGARIDFFETTDVALENARTFSIIESTYTPTEQNVVTPDLSTCEECLTELFDPSNRRYLYPFTTCSSCGPRFSIAESLPFDRERTTMRHFTMCKECLREYQNCEDRRFHAQTISCPVCGPSLELRDSSWNEIGRDQEAIDGCLATIRAGGIVAVKGIGGFHLVCDASNERSVGRLRRSKGRERKPFAVMLPDLASVKEHCEFSLEEEQLLTSKEAPIVLLRARTSQVAPSLAPDNPYLGVMLPYSPLHHIIMKELRFPIVATSGNVSETPLCHTNSEARETLSGLADVVLTHNREISRRADDSVVQVVSGKLQALRLGRGFAPYSISLNGSSQTEKSVDCLAVGGYQKNALAVLKQGRAHLGLHIGDLSTAPAVSAFRSMVESCTKLYGLETPLHISDLHPDYASTQFACEHQSTGVQHHLAHILSVAAEHGLSPPYSGIAWDGTGLGTDGTIWGGEMLHITESGWKRVGSLHSFRLPGGERAIREPRLVGVALLYELFGEELFTEAPEAFSAQFNEEEQAVLLRMLAKGVNSPVTTSMGRLFDGVSALLGIMPIASFEGEAAIALQFRAERALSSSAPYPFEVKDSNGTTRFDWRQMVAELIAPLSPGDSEELGVRAQRFHQTLVKAATRLADIAGERRVLLSGGCFQNRLLAALTTKALIQSKYEVYSHSLTPPNDGGLALGQLNAYQWGFDVPWRSR